MIELTYEEWLTICTALKCQAMEEANRVPLNPDPEDRQRAMLGMHRKISLLGKLEYERDMQSNY